MEMHMPVTKKCFRMILESKPRSAGPTPGAVPPPPPRGEGGKRKEGWGEVDEGCKEVARVRREKGKRGRRCRKVEEEHGDGGAEERKAMVSRLEFVAEAVGEMVA